MVNKILSLMRWFTGFGLAALLFSVLVPAESQALEGGEFSGTWVANGTRELFSFGEERKVYTFELSGHVNLETNIGKKKDYWAQCVGLSDTETGTVARCTWKDLNGPEIYLTLKSEQMGEKRPFTGQIVGGSEHLRGITGELSFLWSSVFVQDRGDQANFTGQTLDLKGSYKIP